MSDPNDSMVLSTIEDGTALLSPIFLEFCTKVRNNDPSILPEPGEPFRIHLFSEKEDMELAHALLENINVTYLDLEMEHPTKSSAEAMAKYVRTSKFLQRIRWHTNLMLSDRVLQHREEILCCFLRALQESTSLKELDIFSLIDGEPSNLALENMLTHTQSLRSLTLSCPSGSSQEIAVAAGLKKNTTLRELKLEFWLEFWLSTTTASPIFTSLRDHPFLRKLCLFGDGVDLTGLVTVLQSHTSKITELEIHGADGGPRIVDLTPVLQALTRHPTLTKLELKNCSLSRVEARLICMVLYSTPSLQSLVLTYKKLGSVGLAELAPALYHNTSIKVLDISKNGLYCMESAEILRDILCSNKTMTALDLSGNQFGRTTGAVDCIAEGLVSNSTLLKLNFSSCALSDGGVSTLAQSLSSRKVALQELKLASNSVTSTGVGVLLERMEQCHRITELDLSCNHFRNEGASLVARFLGNNALPNLMRLSLYRCGIGADGFAALMSALEQNTSLLQLDLRYDFALSEQAFLALAESLPEIKVLQRIDLTWCTGLASAMPLLLTGLRKNTSLFRIHVANCAPRRAPPTPEDIARCAGGWMQDMERLGYRNRFRSLIRAPEESLPPRGVWPHALARAATLHDVIFEVLRSKPNLVPSEDTDGKEAAKDTGVPKKRKRSDD